MTDQNGENRPVLLMITGEIPPGKKQEFEQTYRLASGSFSSECIENWLAADTGKPDRYHFFSVWSGQRSLNNFMNSTEYQLISGAFHALGISGPITFNHYHLSKQGRL